MDGSPHLSPHDQPRLASLRQFLLDQGVPTDAQTGEFNRLTLIRELERRHWSIAISYLGHAYRVLIDRQTQDMGTHAEVMIYGQTITIALMHALERAIREDDGQAHG